MTTPERYGFRARLESYINLNPGRWSIVADTLHDIESIARDQRANVLWVRRVPRDW